MTLLGYHYETGPQSAALTSANTGASLSTINGSAIFDSASALSGNFGGKYSCNANVVCTQRFLPNASSTSMAFSVGFELPSSPLSFDVMFYTLRYSSGVSLSLFWSTTNTVYMTDASGANRITLITGANPGTKYRIAGSVIVATSTTGTYTINTYVGQSTSPINSAPFHSTAYNLGTSAISAVDVGIVSANSPSGTVVMIDDIQFNDGSTTEPPPYFPPLPPTAAFSFNPIGLSVTFDGSASAAVSPATLTGYSWDYGDTNTGTGVTPSHTYVNAGTYTVRLTVTDSNSTMSSISHSVVVAPPRGSVTVASVNTSTGWSPSPGATSLSALTDTDSTTYLTSSINPSNQVLLLTSQFLTPPQAGQPLNVVLGIDVLASVSGGLVTASLIEGSTTRSTLTPKAIPIGSGGSVQGSVVCAFPAADIAAVTSWAALKVQLLVSAS
jgi:PKD repeat protein